jgi:hypothetical protein
LRQPHNDLVGLPERRSYHGSQGGKFDDDTLILADQAEKAIVQIRESVQELLSNKYTAGKDEEVGQTPVGRQLDARPPDHVRKGEAFRIAGPVRHSSGFLSLLSFYPQPVRRQPTVE